MGEVITLKIPERSEEVERQLEMQLGNLTMEESVGAYRAQMQACEETKELIDELIVEWEVQMQILHALRKQMELHMGNKGY